MSAEVLRSAVLAGLEKEATMTADRMLGINTAQTVSQIALQIAGLKGMTLAFQRAAQILNEEHKKLMEPEKAPDAQPKPREIY